MINNQNLTKTEQKVYDLWIGEDLSSFDIANRRGTKERIVKRHIQKIKEKGFDKTKSTLSTLLDMPIIKDVSVLPDRYYRLHNLHFIIRPYYFYPKYKNVERGFGIPFKRWTVTFNKHNIELQLKKKQSFDSIDINECRRLAHSELNVTLIRLGMKYGFEVFKDGKCNIELVNHHFAEVRNGIAVKLKGKKLKISEDGEVWAVADQSIGVPEFETVDPLLATDDMKKLEGHYNAMRVEGSPNVTDLSKIAKQTLQAVQYNAKNINQNALTMGKYAKQVELHLTVLTKMGTALDSINRKLTQERLTRYL